MKLTRVQQLGVVGLLAELGDMDTLLETLDSTGQEMEAAWMRLSDGLVVEILSDVENGLNNLKEAVESMDNEFK